MYNECGEDPETQKTPLGILVAAGVILCLVLGVAVGFSMWGMSELHSVLTRVAQALTTPRRNAETLLQA